MTPRPPAFTVGFAAFAVAVVLSLLGCQTFSPRVPAARVIVPSTVPSDGRVFILSPTVVIENTTAAPLLVDFSGATFTNLAIHFTVSDDYGNPVLCFHRQPRLVNLGGRIGIINVKPGESWSRDADNEDTYYRTGASGYTIVAHFRLGNLAFKSPPAHFTVPFESATHTYGTRTDQTIAVTVLGDDGAQHPGTYHLAAGTELLALIDRVGFTRIANGRIMFTRQSGPTSKAFPFRYLRYETPALPPFVLQDGDVVYIVANICPYPPARR